MTHYVRAVPSVNQDLVVGVGLSLYLLRAVGSWGLPLTEGRTTQKGSPLYRPLLQVKLTRSDCCSRALRLTCQTLEGWCLCHRVGRAKETTRCLCSQTHCGETAEESTTTKQEGMNCYQIRSAGGLIKYKLDGITVTWQDHTMCFHNNTKLTDLSFKTDQTVQMTGLNRAESLLELGQSICDIKCLCLTCPVSYLPCCFSASNTPTVSKIFPSGLFLPQNRQHHYKLNQICVHVW